MLTTPNPASRKGLTTPPTSVSRLPPHPCEWKIRGTLRPAAAAGLKIVIAISVRSFGFLTVASLAEWLGAATAPGTAVVSRASANKATIERLSETVTSTSTSGVAETLRRGPEASCRGSRPSGHHFPLARRTALPPEQLL